MSYILEALKKAQAERQLGNAPTIHAPAPSYAAPAAPRAGSRRTLALGLGAAALAALAALFWWRQAGEQAAPAAAPAASAALIASTASPASSASSAVVPAIPVAPATPGPASAPAVASAPAPVDAAPPAPLARKPARGEVAPVAVPAPPAHPAPQRVADAGAAAAPATVAPAPAEETIRTLQQLPEAIQREIPKVSFGGYIYSPDPAESLLLVDKTLRRAGEEVAPGLVLERLLPQAAVMNYRGYRYRVAY